MPFADQPLISVVMTVYNADRFLPDAIRSVLAQTYSRFELILVDDGSTDSSAAVIRDYASVDARIRPLFLPHGGTARARNAAIALAGGALIAFMDADDIALPERFAAQLAWMRRTGVEICGSCVKRFGDEDGLLWFPEGHAAIRHELVFRIGILLPTVLLDAAIARAHPFDEQASFDDYELGTRLAPRYRLGNVPQVLLRHRCHPQQTHVVREATFRDDTRRYRRRYFPTLFPEATAEDLGLIEQLAERRPLASLADLERAGGWLLRLAQTPDHFLRGAMARRWQVACRLSARLGPGCYRLYRRIMPRFEALPEGGAIALWLACALRLDPGSPISTALARFEHRRKSHRRAQRRAASRLISSGHV